MVNFWQTSVSSQIMFDRGVQYKITVTHHKISFHYHDIIVSLWCKFDFKNNISMRYLQMMHYTFIYCQVCIAICVWCFNHNIYFIIIIFIPQGMVQK